MKKISRKKRKLEFIRVKNDLLSGKRHGYTNWKVSNDVLQLGDDVFSKEKESAILRGWKGIKKKWRLKKDFVRTEITKGTEGDDLIRNLTTFQIKYFLF